MNSHKVLASPQAQCEQFLDKIEEVSLDCIERIGRVRSIKGGTLYATLPGGAVGDICSIETRGGSTVGKIIAFQNELFAISLFDDSEAISPGARVTCKATGAEIQLHREPLGKILNSLGESQTKDAKAEFTLTSSDLPPPHYLERELINSKVNTGIPAVDYFCPLGYGQRIALIAPAGVGKSTLLMNLIAQSSFDAYVVALVGERSREVQEFIKDALHDGNRNQVVFVVSTSDESAQRRAQAPFTATRIAEQLRDQGQNVLLVVDSITRTARSLRDIGLTAGEIPVREGYPGSVFQALPRLIERAGKNSLGSITGVYSILAEPKRIDPLAEEVKSLTDGHWILNRELSTRGIFPAFDLTQSLSRCIQHLATQDELRNLSYIQATLSEADRDRDLVFFSENNGRIKDVLDIEQSIYEFIQNSADEATAQFETLCEKLQRLQTSVSKNPTEATL